MADYLKKGLAEKGCRFYLDSPTNQQFVILENRKMTELKKEVSSVSGKNTMKTTP